jgi:hypothetical protein
LRSSGRRTKVLLYLTFSYFENAWLIFGSFSEILSDEELAANRARTEARAIKRDGAIKRLDQFREAR